MKKNVEGENFHLRAENKNELDGSRCAIYERFRKLGVLRKKQLFGISYFLLFIIVIKIRALILYFLTENVYILFSEC